MRTRTLIIFATTAVCASLSCAEEFDVLEFVPPDNCCVKFGRSVALHGDMAAVGTGRSNNGSQPQLVYVHRETGTSWTIEAVLEPHQVDIDDPNPLFSQSLAAHGEVVAVGAPGAPMEGSSGQGAVYAFRFDGSAWDDGVRLLGYGGAFGRSVAVNGDVIVGGAPLKWLTNDIQAGMAVVFRYDGSTWNEEIQLTAPEWTHGDAYGDSVAMGPDVLVIGAVGDDDAAPNAGAAYVYRNDGSGWDLEAKLTASDAVAENAFGGAVAIDGDVAVVGDWKNSGQRGAAYVFRHDGTGWVEEAKLMASDGQPGDWFSEASISGSTIVIGAWPDDLETGSAYVFRHDGETWNEIVKLVRPNGQSGDKFSAKMAASDGRFLIGARGVDGAWEDSGAAYLYTPALIGDVNDDGVVNIVDLVLLILEWGEPCIGGCAADLDGDGIVSVTDLVLLIMNWGA